MTKHSPEFIHARLASARQIAEDPNGTLLEVAQTWGITKAGASMFLESHDPTLRLHFRESFRTSNSFTAEEALWRLKLIKKQDDAGKTRVNTAKLLGINPSGLSMWISRWASDSIEQAISDLEELTNENVLCNA